MPPSSPAERDDLIVSWRQLAMKIANWHICRAPGIRRPHTDDIRAAALEGLVRAAHSYDPERGVSFASYAGKRIMGAVLDWSRGEDHLSRHFRELAKASGAEDLGPPAHLEDIPGWHDHFESFEAMADDLVAERQAVAAIELAARALPQKKREVLRLYYVEDLTQKQIGQQFGLTESRICQILHEAHAKLRAVLGEPMAPGSRPAPYSRRTPPLRRSTVS